MTELNWIPCPCGAAVCKRSYPEEMGRFPMGAGFEPAERDRIEAAFRAARLLREAYQAGNFDGACIDWADLDEAHAVALQARTSDPDSENVCGAKREGI